MQVRIKVGAVVGQDMKYAIWPEEVQRELERDANPLMIFEAVKVNGAHSSDDRYICRADGFGIHPPIGRCGNGALWVYAKDLIPLSEKDKAQMLKDKVVISKEEAVKLILSELERAEAQHSKWPTDPIHRAAILAEEAGEAVQASIDLTYCNGSIEDFKKELIQTGAMAIRNLINMHSHKINTDQDQ